MSIKIGHLFQVDFDNMENRDPIVRNKIASFAEGDGRTAYAKAEAFLQQLAPVRPYLGWDRRIYPKFVYEEEECL